MKAGKAAVMAVAIAGVIYIAWGYAKLRKKRNLMTYLASNKEKFFEKRRRKFKRLAKGGG